MPLAPSTRIGAYEIAASIGAGGMGEVYRARDTRLGRDVALKVLPLSRHDDPELLERFEREARLLAALNDAHIAAIYDIVTVGDHRAIVMELVAGEPLTDVIARGPVPVRLALRYAIDISHALSVAHAAGIVHRDLKPGNIMITPAGTAKVLDFGVAKLQAGDGPVQDGRTITVNTRPNTALGTPAYMSPEQAHGRPVDARSDIFSFGVVMHEMISGRPAFEGESTAALLSAILRDDPPSLRALAPATPRAVERCVARCLEKDPARRYQHASDLKAALEDVRDDLQTGERTTPVSSAETLGPRAFGKARWRSFAVAAAMLAVAVAAFMAGAGLRNATPQIPTFRPFVTEATGSHQPVWSPDGRTLAYVAQVDGDSHIFLRAVDAAQATQLTKQPVRTGLLFWSPDGSRLYFIRAKDAAFVSVSAGGGEPNPVPISFPEPPQVPPQPNIPQVLDAGISPDGRTIAFVYQSKGGPRLNSLDLRTGEVTPINPSGLPQPLALMTGLEFSPDGSSLALFANNTTQAVSRGLWIVSRSTQSARYLFGDAPYLMSSTSWLPDSRRLVISAQPIAGGGSRLLLADTRTGVITPLTPGKDDEIQARVSSDGTKIAIVSARRGLDLIQFGFDEGPPEPILASSRNESWADMSASGVLAYLTDADGPLTVRLRSGASAWPRTIAGDSPFDRERGIQPREPRVSPDAQRLAVGTFAAEHLIWIYPSAGGTPVRLDSETTDQHGPSWSPDGNWVAYRRLQNGKWELVKRPLGGGPAVRLDDTTLGGAATDWSPTGEWIAYLGPNGILHLISPDGTSKRELTGLRSGIFRFSRDGRQLLAMRRGEKRAWTLAVWDIATAREVRTLTLPLAASASIEGMTLTPDGSRIILGVGAPTSDIWILENFAAPRTRRWLPW